ncbi:hypothetical protein IJG72_03835 [bacterium]|nr:hypothetical protein [bacterium]
MNISKVVSSTQNSVKRPVINTGEKQLSTNIPKVNVSNNNVSFNGVGSTLANGANKVFKYIDRSSFFVEFLIVDTLSMVVPRIMMGLFRDRDKLGHLNWKSAKEEAGREVLSGPSMNLIPMGILTAVSALKPASRIERNDLAYLSEVAKATTQNNKLNSKNIAEKIYEASFGETKENVAERICDAISGHTKENKNKFVELLEKTTQTKGKERKQALNEFVEFIKSLNNNSASKTAPIHADTIMFNLEKINSSAARELNLSTKSISAENLADAFKAFKNDIIEKVNSSNVKNIPEFIEKLKKNRSTIKFATAITAFLAVGTFLKALPKLYQQKGLSPAQESALRASKGQGAKV